MPHKTFGPGARVLIVGATAGIAVELAREFARHGSHLILAARDGEELARIAADARVRGAHVETREFGALDYDSHADFWRGCGDVDGVICCFGILPDEERARHDWELCQQLLEINFNANISLLNLVANTFEKRRSGFIGVLSSVAGDRARRGNYLYSCTKSGLSAYVEGLRARLFPAGVSVTTIKPGPVDTGMTFGMEQLPLLAPPDAVARDIYRGLRRGADVVYTPGIWRAVMFVMKIVPGFVWKRLDF